MADLPPNLTHVHVPTAAHDVPVLKRLDELTHAEALLVIRALVARLDAYKLEARQRAKR